MNRHQAFRSALGLAFGVICLAAGSSSATADIIVDGSFSSTGDVGFVNSPPITINFGNSNGPATPGNGLVFQMDGFINAAGQNWNNNGSGSGTSAQLSFGIPAGLSFGFHATSVGADLVLDYVFVNNTGSTLNDFQFMFFVDADISDDFTNEWVSQAGVLAEGPFDPATFQVGDPASSSIFSNLMAGTLDNTDEFSTSSLLGDPAIALGFVQPSFAPGSVFEIQVLLSDVGHTIGSFSLTQQDPDLPGDTLTVSGLAAVPEPDSLLLSAIGLSGVALAAVVRRRRALAH